MAAGAILASRFAASLRGYQTAWAGPDAVAGLTLAAIAIPEQLATARLAGLPPETGLYAFTAGTLGIAAFGASRYISVGADSTITPIFAGALATVAAAGPDYAAAAALLAVGVGIVLLVAGLVRAGWLADLLSVPVTVGFLAGISIHIAVGQLPSLLGVADPGGALLPRLARILAQAGSANHYAVSVGVFGLICGLVGERFGPRVPGALIGLAVTAVAAALFGLGGRGVAMVGAVTPHLPSLTLPSPSSLRALLPLAPLVPVVTLVCMMQTAAVARSFPSDPDGEDDVSRDFAGVGAGCLIAGLFGGFAVNSSPPRTAVVAESGGRSQAAGLIAVALVLAALLIGGGLLAELPQAALSGVLLFIAIRIFRLREIAAIARTGGYEIWLVVASAALVVTLPIESGMLLAIGLSLLHSLYVLARPACVVLGRVPGTSVWWPPEPGQPAEQVPGVLVFALAAPLNFTNAQFVRRRLEAALAAAPLPVRLVVLEASGMIDVDYTGGRGAAALVARLRRQGSDVALARLSSEPGRSAAARTGLLAAIGADREFRSVQEAIDALATGRGTTARA